MRCFEMSLHYYYPVCIVFHNERQDLMDAAPVISVLTITNMSVVYYYYTLSAKYTCKDCGTVNVYLQCSQAQ